MQLHTARRLPHQLRYPPVDTRDAAPTFPLASSAPTILRPGRRVSDLLHDEQQPPPTASFASLLGPPGAFEASSPSSSSTLSAPSSPSAWEVAVNDDSQFGKRCQYVECENPARSRGLCPLHGGGTRCKVDDCVKHAVSGGRCVSHGGGKRCTVPVCANSAVSRGLCVQHGGGRKCKHDGCTKHVASGGLCRAHGGGRRCKIPNCMSSAQSRGLCYVHGGGGRCQQPGCASSAKKGGYCIAHGGGHRCQVRGCSSSAVSGDLCRAHGGGKRCAVENCKSSAKTGGLCIAHGGGKRCTVVGCKSSAQRLGLCKAHGGGRKCTALGCANSAVSRGKCIAHGGGKRCVFEGCSTTARRGGFCFAHGGHARSTAAASTLASRSHDDSTGTSLITASGEAPRGEDQAVAASTRASTMKRARSKSMVTVSQDDSAGRKLEASALKPSPMLLTPKPTPPSATMTPMTPPLAPTRPRLPSMSLLLSAKHEGVRGAERVAAIPPILYAIPPRRYSSDTDDTESATERICDFTVDRCDPSDRDTLHQRTSEIAEKTQVGRATLNMTVPSSQPRLPARVQSPKTPGYLWRRLQETVRLESKAQGLVDETESGADDSEDEEEVGFPCAGGRKSDHMSVMCA